MYISFPTLCTSHFLLNVHLISSCMYIVHIISSFMYISFPPLCTSHFFLYVHLISSFMYISFPPLCIHLISSCMYISFPPLCTSHFLLYCLLSLLLYTSCSLHLYSFYLLYSMHSPVPAPTPSTYATTLSARSGRIKTWNTPFIYILFIFLYLYIIYIFLIWGEYKYIKFLLIFKILFSSCWLYSILSLLLYARFHDSGW